VAVRINIGNADASLQTALQTSNETRTATFNNLSVASNFSDLSNSLTLTPHATRSAGYVQLDSDGSGQGTQGWTFSKADNAFDFLAADEKLTAVYTVTFTDVQTKAGVTQQAATVSQDVTITVTGVNDAPTVTSNTLAETANVSGLGALLTKSCRDPVADRFANSECVGAGIELVGDGGHVDHQPHSHAGHAKPPALPANPGRSAPPNRTWIYWPPGKP
jgi:VCBS repeat-containing protein